MIKIKDLREAAHKRKLKLSDTAYGQADRLAAEIVMMGCTRALNMKSPKLEGRHFDDISVLPDGGVLFREKELGSKKIKAKIKRRDKR